MLKREFGKDISFWGGGVNMQQTVVTGSVQDIKDEARRHIEIFSKDGGYVFTQVHNIQANVPPEKVIAIYEAAAEFR
jgi:uroporphyrinogen decarboxylase